MQRLQSLVRRLFPLTPANVPASCATPTPLAPEALKSVSGGLPNGTWPSCHAATVAQKPTV
jgi:hypothetical protein